jgi:hypothetical protein
LGKPIKTASSKCREKLIIKFLCIFTQIIFKKLAYINIKYIFAYNGCVLLHKYMNMTEIEKEAEREFKRKFNYVPVSAQLMFNEYKNIQDRMVYENFRQSYQNVLC